MGGGPHGGSKPETKGTGQAEACPARSAIASLQRGTSTDCALRRNCALVFSGCYTRPRHLPRPRQSSAERRERANKLRCRWEAGVLKLEESQEGSSRPPHALDDERLKTARSGRSRSFFVAASGQAFIASAAEREVDQHGERRPA